VCVGCVVNFRQCVCVCESLVGFVNLGLINSGDNRCLLLFWPEVNWVWNSSEPTGEEE
jgi:hypothetical protein